MFLFVLFCNKQSYEFLIFSIYDSFHSFMFSYSLLSYIRAATNNYLHSRLFYGLIDELFYL